MNKNEESLNNVLIKSKDSDELSGIDSPTKSPSLKPNEISIIRSHEVKKKEGDYIETSRVAKQPSEPEDHSPVQVDIGNRNMPDTTSSSDAAQESTMNRNESEAEVIDSKSVDCEANQCGRPEEDDGDVYEEEEDFATSEVDMYSEEDSEEEYREDVEFIPFRHRRRYFGESDEAESFDKDEEGIDRNDSSHGGLSQTDTESEEDLSEDEDESSDSENRTEVDEVVQKLARINRNDPTFMPRQGAIFMHEENNARHQPLRWQPSGSRACIMTPRWSRDAYNDKEQRLRSTNEIPYRYVCSNREGDIGEINDVTFSSFPVQRRSNDPRGRSWERAYREAQNPPKPDSVVFDDDDFPSLQEVEELYHRRRGGFTFSRNGNPQSTRPNIRNNNLPRCGVLQSTQTQSPIQMQSPGNDHPSNEGTQPNSRNRPPRHQDFHRDSNHRNLDRRPGLAVPAHNSNSKRYSSNRPRYNEDTQSQRNQQQLPTQLVMIRDRPDHSQIHQNNRSYNRNSNNNNNNGGRRYRQY